MTPVAQLTQRSFSLCGRYDTVWRIGRLKRADSIQNKLNYQSVLGDYLSGSVGLAGSLLLNLQPNGN
jgi:hypothetical protein